MPESDWQVKLLSEKCTAIRNLLVDQQWLTGAFNPITRVEAKMSKLNFEWIYQFCRFSHVLFGAKYRSTVD
jgi:hypothetical protein